MSNGPLLSIRPKEITFEVELEKPAFCNIMATNDSKYYVAFKVKNASPKKYSVRPNIGVIHPGDTGNIMITLEAQKELSPDLECKDTFLVQSTKLPRRVIFEDNLPDLFNKDGNNVIEECKLTVFYIHPQSGSVKIEEESGDNEVRGPDAQSSQHLQAELVFTLQQNKILQQKVFNKDGNNVIEMCKLYYFPPRSGSVKIEEESKDNDVRGSDIQRAAEEAQSSQCLLEEVVSALQQNKLLQQQVFNKYNVIVKCKHNTIFYVPLRPGSVKIEEESKDNEVRGSDAQSSQCLPEEVVSALQQNKILQQKVFNKDGNNVIEKCKPYYIPPRSGGVKIEEESEDNEVRGSDIQKAAEEAQSSQCLPKEVVSALQQNKILQQKVEMLTRRIIHYRNFAITLASGLIGLLIGMILKYGLSRDSAP